MGEKIRAQRIYSRRGANVKRVASPLRYRLPIIGLTAFDKSFIVIRYIEGGADHVEASLVIRRAADRVRRAADSHHRELADGRRDPRPARGQSQRAMDHG